MYSPQLPLARGRVPLQPETEKPRSETGLGGDLESSLLQLFQDHHLSSLRLREQSEKAKRDAVKKAAEVSEQLVDSVNGGVQECFVNEKRIEMEIRSLAVTISRYVKLTNQWLSATHAINSAIKEIGDFENWMKTMEFDCKSINAAIYNIHQE